MQRVFNFSGGKTSAFMTIKYYQPGDLVIFCDTGREHPKTYKFLNDFEAFENIPIIRLKYEGGFEGMLKVWGNGHYGKKIPNMMKRQCTIELKIKTARRYMRKLGVMEYENIIGFRADEPLRVSRHKENWKKVTTNFLLYNDGTDKQIVNNYWKNKPYTLEIPSILGNCTLCFMKGKNAVSAILREYPELADPWIKDEDESKKYFGHTYFKGITISQLRDIAQNNLFKDYDLNEISPAFNCACTA